MMKGKRTAKPIQPMSEDEGDRLLTVVEVSEYLRIGPESIRRWLRVGKLPGINLGRGSGWRIRRADLAKLIDDKRPVLHAAPAAPAEVRPPVVHVESQPNGAVAVHVTCVKKRPLQNPHTGVTHLGNTDRQWTRDEVVAAIDAGTHTFYTLNGNGRAEIQVCTGPFSRYVRTRVDGQWTDGLLTLGDCPT
jgi:excisionase family DNA binding protein